MPARTLLKWPDKRLKLTSSNVLKSENYNQLIEDMRDTMIANFGLGIAAPQVGILKNIVVVDYGKLPSFDEDPNFKGLVVMINPEFISASKKKILSLESCLSIPGLAEQVERNKDLELLYLNSEFEKIEISISGAQSCIVQHECDHLVGKLFINRMSSVRYRRFLSKKKKEFRAKKRESINTEEKTKAQILKKRKRIRDARKKRSKK